MIFLGLDVLDYEGFVVCLTWMHALAYLFIFCCNAAGGSNEGRIFVLSSNGDITSNIVVAGAEVSGLAVK